MPDPASSISTSVSLLARVGQREPRAWEEFTQLYGPVVYCWGRRAGLNCHDAADIVQNVFLAVARNVHKLSVDGPGDSFRGWLWILTRNRVRDFWRSGKGKPQAEGGTEAERRLLNVSDRVLADADPEPSETRRTLVHQALEVVRSASEPHTWDAFWRTAVEGKDAAEVAAALGMTPKAVRQAKYRVLCSLRQLLADAYLPGGSLD
jgi:RNA polymerase sigma-70 factor (ECF subfamily)